MNMRTFSLAAGGLLIAAGAALLFLDRDGGVLKNLGYVIWGVGLILANWNRENKTLTGVGTILNIIGPIVLIVGFVLRFV